MKLLCVVPLDKFEDYIVTRQYRILAALERDVQVL